MAVFRFSAPMALLRSVHVQIRVDVVEITVKRHFEMTIKQPCDIKELTIHNTSDSLVPAVFGILLPLFLRNVFDFRTIHQIKRSNTGIPRTPSATTRAHAAMLLSTGSIPETSLTGIRARYATAIRTGIRRSAHEPRIHQRMLVITGGIITDTISSVAGTQSVRFMGIDGIIIVVIMTGTAADAQFETGIGAANSFDRGRCDSRNTSAGMTGSHGGVADGCIGWG